jgi:hypothetical protein
VAHVSKYSPCAVCRVAFCLFVARRAAVQTDSLRTAALLEMVEDMLEALLADLVETEEVLAGMNEIAAIMDENKPKEDDDGGRS